MKKLMVLVLLCSNSVFAESLEPSTQPMRDVSVLSTFLSKEAKIETVLKEVKCEDYLANKGKRRKIVREIKRPMFINQGMQYIGQTFEGDVVEFENKDGKNMYTLYFCERPMVNSDIDIQIINQPILNVDSECVVGQVTAANFNVAVDFPKSEDGSDALSPYQLAFYPLNLSQDSSLCIERKEISEAQAKEVYRYLIEKGIIADSNPNDSDSSENSAKAVRE